MKNVKKLANEIGPYKLLIQETNESVIILKCVDILFINVYVL